MTDGAVGHPTRRSRSPSRTGAAAPHRSRRRSSSAPSPDRPAGLPRRHARGRAAAAGRDPSISLGDIGGPSAGLMFALAVVDKLTPGELTGGRFVAGHRRRSRGRRGRPDRRHPVQDAGRAGRRRDGVPGAGRKLRRGPERAPDGLALVRVDNLAEAVAGWRRSTTAATRPPAERLTVGGRAVSRAVCGAARSTRFGARSGRSMSSSGLRIASVAPRSCSRQRRSPSRSTAATSLASRRSGAAGRLHGQRRDLLVRRVGRGLGDRGVEVGLRSRREHHDLLGQRAPDDRLRPVDLGQGMPDTSVPGSGSWATGVSLAAASS